MPSAIMYKFLTGGNEWWYYFHSVSISSCLSMYALLTLGACAVRVTVVSLSVCYRANFYIPRLRGQGVWGAVCVIGEEFIFIVDIYHSVVDIYINPLFTVDI